MRTLPFKARVYWVMVVGAGLTCLVLFIPRASFSREFVLAWLILATLDFLTEVFEVEVIPQRSLSVAISVGTAAICIGGIPLAVLTILTGSFFAEFVLRWEKLRMGASRFFTYVAFNTCQLVASVTFAGLVFNSLGGSRPPYTAPVEFIPPALAFLVYVIANAGLVGVMLALTQERRLVSMLRSDLRHLYAQLLSLGVLALVMAVVYPLSPWYVALVASPLMVVQGSIRSYARLREQAKEAFERIACIVGERDKYTGTHSEEVAKLALKLARALRLPDELADRIGAAAWVHDLGKIAVPDNILLKPGKLTAEEWEVIKRHPVTGAEILQGLEIYEGIVGIVRHEHEHWDGGGYPDGLAGERIPLGSRILAVADVWNALTTDRPYRPAYTVEDARSILREMAGSVLDPRLVDLYLTLEE